MGTIIEEIFDRDSDVQTVAAKPFFQGEALGFTVTGAVATVDANGVIRIPTDTALSGMVTVVATNSGGSAAQSFQVTVEDAVEISPPSPRPAEARWEPPSHTATRRMPLVFPSEAGVAGYVPADAMQQWHALDWCLGNPDVIYGMQDTGGIWLSRDHGRTGTCRAAMGSTASRASASRSIPSIRCASSATWAAAMPATGPTRASTPLPTAA